MGEGNEGMCLLEGKGEPILELSVGADIHRGLKVTQINNSAIICLHV